MIHVRRWFKSWKSSRWLKESTNGLKIATNCGKWGLLSNGKVNRGGDLDWSHQHWSDLWGIFVRFIFKTFISIGEIYVGLVRFILECWMFQSFISIGEIYEGLLWDLWEIGGIYLALNLLIFRFVIYHHHLNHTWEKRGMLGIYPRQFFWFSAKF